MSSDPSGAGRLGSLDLLRFLASFMVVLFHSWNFASQGNPGGVFHGNLVIATHGVDIFFVLSGFVIFDAHRHDFGTRGRFGRYVRRRFLRIYPPYWFALLFALGCALFFPAHQKLTALNIIRSITLLPNADIDYPFVIPAWTLQYEMLFYLAFGICLLLPRRLGALLLIAWPVSIFVLHRHGWQGSFPISFSMSVLVLEFALGMAAALLYRRLNTIAGLVLFAVGLLLVGTAMRAELLGYVLFPVMAPISALGLGAAMIITGCAAIERRRGSIQTRLTTFLGGLSYSTYLVHYTFFIFVSYAFGGRFNPGSGDLACCGFVAIGLLAGVAFYIAIERPILRCVRSGWNVRNAWWPAEAQAIEGSSGGS